MIPRKLAKRLLDEYLDGVERSELVAPDDGTRRVEFAAIRDELLEESDLVLRGTENAEQKARRYLAEGRVTVEQIDQRTGAIIARVRGEEGEYRAGYSPRRNEWRCTCPAPRRCSHLIALRLVVRPS